MLWIGLPAANALQVFQQLITVLQASKGIVTTLPADLPRHQFLLGGVMNNHDKLFWLAFGEYEGVKTKFYDALLTVLHQVG